MEAHYMRRILLPLEQTDRSLKALQYFRKHYKPDEAGVIILMVDEGLGYSAKMEEEEAAIRALNEKLDLIKSFLDGYDVITKAYVGKAGQRIVKVAREYGTSLIAMTKSSQADMLNQIGKTTEYVLLNAPCNVVIVSESRDANEYRGLVYTKAQSVVNLRGQIGDKQSECLLPSVTADCNYHIDVSVGRVRFFHTAYNPETGNWDLPPAGGQEASVDITAGESADILVKAGSTEGKADRIRIVNRGIKEEAVFTYLITPAVLREKEEKEEPEETEPVQETEASQQFETVEELIDTLPVVEEEVVEEEAVEEKKGPKVIVASQNKNKIAELKAIFDKYGMEIIPRDDAGLPEDEVEETGSTCEENSLIKAKAVREMIACNDDMKEYFDSPVIADDTGLWVDALNGEPGIYSARYAGENATYKDNYTKLIHELEGVPEEERTAHFITVITMLYPNGEKVVASGLCEGRIGTEPKGEEGFGYDPVFIPAGYDQSFAELGQDFKNEHSHRAKALAQLERILEEK